MKKPKKTMPSTPNEQLPVGRIAGIFGIQGELKCDPTSAGRTLFTAGAHFQIRLSDGTARNVQLSGVREHKNRLLVRLPGVDSANDAEKYAGATFYVDRSRIMLEPGEHLDRDLEGCSLYDESGRVLGNVTRVEHYPSSDMLVVNGELVPMVSAFIKSIDTNAKRIVVDLPAGLLDSENAERA
jgi:16S rRNA processing protein RimM